MRFIGTTSGRVRLATAAVALGIVAPVAATSATAATGSTPGATLDFAFVGDMPYATDFTSSAMLAWADDINASGAAFVAHSGDFKGGNDSCADSRMTTTVGYYNYLTRPFWATPGDNDWTDCHRNTNGSTSAKPNGGDSAGTGLDPAERLAKVRSLFYAANPHQTNVGGGTPLALQTQADSTDPAQRAFAENTVFTKACVTFGDIHSVSSANGLLTPTQGSKIKSSSANYINQHAGTGTPNDYSSLQSARNDEVAARTAADIAWIDRIFDIAQADPANEGIFLMMQAEPALYGDQPASSGAYTQSTTDPYGATEPPIFGNDIVSGHDEFFDIRAELYKRAQAYGKPVVLAHGDQHVKTVTPNYLTMNQSRRGTVSATDGTPKATGLPDLPALANTTRLENYGSNGAGSSGTSNWIEVQATCGTTSVFAQRARAVGSPGSAGAFTPMFAGTPSAALPESPVAVLLLAGPAVLGAGYLARRRSARARRRLTC